MSLGMIAVLSIVGTTTLVYTTSNARSGVLSKDNERAFSLAEAGLNNAMAVLSLPTNNALDPDVLPSTEATASSARCRIFPRGRSPRCRRPEIPRSARTAAPGCTATDR